MVSLNPHSGEILWAFDSGSPLVSVQQRHESSLDAHLSSLGVDGGLYAYYSGGGGQDRGGRQRQGRGEQDGSECTACMLL